MRLHLGVRHHTENPTPWLRWRLRFRSGSASHTGGGREPQGWIMNASRAQAEQVRGAYPVRVAARLAHLAPRTARRWIEGYDYDYQGERRRSDPVAYLSHVAGEGANAILDFEQLLTLLLVKAFNGEGLGLPTIKRAARRAKDLYRTRNPFITKQFRSDGNNVFVDLEAPGRERELINVLSDQREFREIVEPFLFKDIVFIGENAGEWWPLGPDRAVVLIPNRQFGAPHIASRGVRTDVVAQAVTAEGGGKPANAAVADWFGLTYDQVKDAVEFEGPWQAQAVA